MMRALAVIVFFGVSGLMAVAIARIAPLTTTAAVQLMPSRDGLQTVGVEPAGPVEVFQIDAGACLRGPLKIGAFSLGAGVEYPTGCSAAR